MQDYSLTRCALEERNFPFERFSEIAEQESWRKDINRPIYHIHKWWAQRLGSVFRAIILGALSSSDTDLYAEFYCKQDLSNFTIFDPFMGSGTTLGEAAKLGAKVIGKDINPVAYFLVKNALSMHSTDAILNEFNAIQNDTAEEIKKYYKTTLPNGHQADVLYYFWVKTIGCPNCKNDVDLFSTRIFAKHAYPKRYPKAQATCPKCGEVNQVLYNDTEVQCCSCKISYNPQNGYAKGQNATCPICQTTFKIAQAVRCQSYPPKHRLYAKLILSVEGEKIYSSITKEDLDLYFEASTKLRTYRDAYPVVKIKPGNNTDQVLGYNYKYWHEMFNERQLFSLAVLAKRLQKIHDEHIRNLFVCLFSGMLEFNNMFVSYKGEGTGAVRHMFAHHILKPERVPLEANLWGTTKSSGSFMTMFKGRICKALNYAENPFELALNEEKIAEKIYNISYPLGFHIAKSYSEFLNNNSIYLSCGDSSNTDIPDKSIDAVITDPPFFDNVHYSELADFFYVWQNHILSKAKQDSEDVTTRSTREVQNANPDNFTKRLSSVLKESHRVLKDSGVLAFTYHHSKDAGWKSLLKAIMSAGFVLTAVQPIKAEMSVAMPKALTKEPINIDVILVCRKRSTSRLISHICRFSAIKSVIDDQVSRFYHAGRVLSKNDIKVIAMANCICQLSKNINIATALDGLESHINEIEATINSLYGLYFEKRN